ncbi:ThuA domain-containing protein [Litorivivens sp.]|uniref:ThuA domain-containing protein n=1 Tax=Litorivivens sp. TaxID=2020868 RepID=UPI00356A5EF6
MKKLLFAVFGIILVLVIGVVAAFLFDQPQFISGPEFDHAPPTVELDAESPALLVFSKTNGFRHKEGIQAAQTFLHHLAQERGWQIVTTENGAVHNPQDLARFNVVIWANASGPLLLPEQRDALKSYVENGGGFIGIHAAGDGSHKDWSWYQNTILGTAFIGHTLIPHKQNATITLQQEHPVVRGLPATWQHYDEWYAFDRSPAASGATVLLNVDENSYKPGKFTMTPDHPVVWVKTAGKGRTLYSALGHSAKSFDTPEYQQLLTQAIQWAGKLSPQER